MQEDNIGGKWRTLTMNEHELELLLRSLVDNLTAIRQEIRAIHEDQKAADANRGNEPIRPVPVEFLTDPIPKGPIREYYETENRERNSWFGRHKRWIETCGVIAAVLIAGLTATTTLEIRKQTAFAEQSAKAAIKVVTDAETRFQLDERAWMTIDQAALTQPESGKPVTISIQAKNTGKTPARAVQYASWTIKLGDRNLRSDSVTHGEGVMGIGGGFVCCEVHM